MQKVVSLGVLQGRFKPKPKLLALDDFFKISINGNNY
jgi:hypothetical protein